MRPGSAHAATAIGRATSRVTKRAARRASGCALGGMVGCSIALAAFPGAASVADAASPAPTTGNPATTPAAGSAATWLTRQLATGHGLMPGLTAGVPDVGLTSDTLLSLVAAGQRQESGFAASLAAVASHLSGYATFPAGGTTAFLAGPVAKTLFLAEVSGADPTSFGGRDLPTTVRSLLTTTGPNTGRFSDSGTGSDTSNGFSQAFALLGLSRVPGGAPNSAISYLLDQQCPSGAFRLFYDTPGGCRNNNSADPDATSMAVQALSGLLATGPGGPAISTARTSAARWLASRQQPDGGLGGAGPTSGENANTTALAAIAFRETGLVTAAAAAQRYVTQLQIPTGSDAGAVAYDPAALSAIGHAGSIPSTDEDQWRRSTSQAILAFGLPGYDELPTISGAPLPGGSPTPPPPSSPPTSAPPTPAPPTTFPAGPPPADHTPGTPDPATNSSAAAGGFGNQPASDLTAGNPAFDNPAPDNTAADGSADGTATDGPSAGVADQSTDAVQPPSDSPTSGDPSAPATQTPAPLTSAASQAAVTRKSADGGVPRWVWLIVAAGAGVGGGVVVLRLQTKRVRP